MTRVSRRAATAAPRNLLPLQSLIKKIEASRSCRVLRMKDINMKKITLLAAAALLAGSSVYGYAAPKGAGATNAQGASEFSPGDQMRDSGGPKKGARGASEFSPGDRMRDAGGPKKDARGASEFSPGDKMNDARGR